MSTVSIWSSVGTPFLSSSPRIASSFSVVRAPPNEAVPWMVVSRLPRRAGLVARLVDVEPLADGETTGETEADGEMDGDAEGESETEGDGDAVSLGDGEAEPVSEGDGERVSLGEGAGDVSVAVGEAVWAKLGPPSIAR